MSKPRGRRHTTLTETGALVVSVLKKIPGIKMIAPGKISTQSKTRSGKRHCTIVYTTAGFELIVSGQGVQNIAVHITNTNLSPTIAHTLKTHKLLTEIFWQERYSKLDL